MEKLIKEQNPTCMKVFLCKVLFTMCFVSVFFVPVVAQNALTTLGLTSSTPASVAYSVRKLSSGYSGPLMRIYNGTNSYDVWPDASGNFSTTSVISAANPGLTPGTKNGTTALSTITSGTTFTVAIWYDQSGNARNLTQSTTANRPTIITAGTINTRNSKVAINYDATNDGMGYTGSDYLTTNPISVNVVAGSNSSGTGVRRAVQGATTNWLIGPYFNQHAWFAGGVSFNHQISTPWSTTALEAFTVIQPSSTDNTSRRNGASQTSGNNKGLPGRIQTGTTSTYPEPLDGVLSEVLAFNSELSNTDRQAIETSQGTYFGITLPDAPTISAQPSTASQSICLNGTPTNLSVTASVNSGSIVYQWYSNASANNSGGTPIASGATSSTYTPITTASGSTSYYCVLTNSSSGYTTTSNVSGAVAVSATYPTLGTYSATTVIAGQNASIRPSIAPTNSTSIVAYSNTNFSGTLTVNPLTGDIRVTNAKQAGTYLVTVKAFNSGGCTSTTTFTLTVTNPLCGQGNFSGNTEVAVGPTSPSVAIGDFNGDGIQDIAVPNNGSTTVSIRLGDGTGSFSGSTEVSVGLNPYLAAIGDFNGDGNQDFAVTNIGSASVSIRLGDGNGGFSGSTEVGVGTSPNSVAIGDFNGDGKQDIAAVTASASVSIRLGDGNGGFSGSTDVGVGNGPRLVAIGDFNRDGIQDIAVANYSSNSVSIRLGDGTGGFTGSTEVGVGTNPNSVAISDFNGDGIQDIATANINSASVSIRIGDGNGGFSGSTEVGVGLHPISIAIGDFNGDGKQDIAVSKNNSTTVSISLGDGNGGFSGNKDISVGNSPQTLSIGDFNSDGMLDIATGNTNSNSVSIRLGGVSDVNIKGNNVSIIDGDNTPATPDNTDFGSTCILGTIVKTFTFENTGVGSLTLNSGAITVTGTDNAMFTIGGITLPASIAAGSSTTFMVTYSPTSPGIKTATVHIASDDCDESDYDFALQGNTIATNNVTLGGYSDTTVIAGQNVIITPTASPTNSTSIVAYSTTKFSGTFTANPTTGVVSVTNAKQAGTYLVTVKATNSVGCAVTTTFTQTVTNPNCSQANFGASTTISVEINPRAVAVGDFNRDGNQDMAAANSGSSSVSILLGDGNGGFSGNTNVGVGSSPYSVAIGDFNGDGIQDIATANQGSSSVSIRLGDGNGSFSGSTEVSVGTRPYSVAIGDFNGDGIQDIAAANQGSSSVSIRLGDGNGGFSGSTNVSVGSQPYSVAIGDFNGDGKQDIAVANFNSASVSIRLGDGNGGFSGSTNLSVGSQPYSVAIGDFNGDGYQDIAVAHGNSASVSILLGNGAGVFSRTNFYVGLNPRSVAIGDFNGDGNQDIAVSRVSANLVCISLGDGAGAFSAPTNVGVGTTPTSVAIGDFNGDGKQDIATANFSSANVSILLGVGSDINIKGNTVSIVDGDNTPFTSDYTDFGYGTYTRSFTIENTGTTPLNISGVTVRGTNASDFVVSTAPASTVAASGSTTFVVTFTPSGGCIRNATIQIASDDCDEGVYDFAVQAIANALPAPIFTAQPGATACVSTDVTYTTELGQTNYVWTVPGTSSTDYTITSGSIETSSNTVTLKWLTAGSKTVTINYTNSSGCNAASATSSTATTVSALPTPTFTAQPGATACVGSDVIYTTQSGQTSYIWTIPGTSGTDYSITSSGFGTSSNTVTLKWLTAGSKTLTINYTSSGCTAVSATSSTATTVSALPTPTFTAQPGATACVGSDVTYTTQSGQSSYIWTIPGASGTDYSITSSGFGTSSNTVTLKWLTAGSKTITINYTSSGCTAAATSSTATTVSALPTPTISAGGATTFCNGGSVLLTAGNTTGNVRSGNALTFSKGSSQYVSVPHSASLNLPAFTMEAWVNYSGENITIIDKGNYNFLWSLNANNNGNKMGFYNNSNFLWNYSTAAVAQNTWTHVAITLSGGTLTFYINGVASGTASVGSSTADNIEMNIGRQQPSLCRCNHFNGTMDELRIWNVARSQSDILANYESTVPTNSSNLVAYYKFDESTGTTTADASSNGNNGTLVNGPTRQVPSTSPVLLHNDFIWYNGAANIATTQSITATTTGSYTVKVTLPNGCYATSVATSVAVSALPTAAAAGDDQTGSATCGLTQVTLAGNAPNVGTGAWSIVSGTGGSFADASSRTSTFTGTAGSSYTLRWTISNSPCTASTDDVVITFNKNPTTANAGVDQNFSPSGGAMSTTLAGNAPTVGTGLWTIVSGSGGTITTPSSHASTFTGTAGVTYTLRWTISNSPCNSYSDDVQLSSGNVWTGNTSNLWNVATNWSLGTIPTSSDIVIINTITPRAPQLNVDFTVGGSLTISGTGTLTVNAGKTLSLASTGTADFGGKLVTFKSDATGSAQFGQMLGTLSNASNVTVERHIPASNRTFRLISSPVTTTTSIRYNWMENATLGVDSYPYAAGSAQNPNAGYGTHITGSNGNTNGFDQTGSNNPSLFTHDNSGVGAWNTVTTTAGTLAAGDAYRIQIRGDRGYAIFASPVPAQSATTLRTNGTLYTGNKTVNLNTTADGFSMIGNPYQATVDMYAAGIIKTNITGYYYIWDPRMGIRGAYVSYGGSVIGSNNILSAVNQYLQPGQAIFVQTSNTGGAASIEFGESAKSIASNQTLVFSRFKGNAGVEFGAEPNAPQTTYTSLNTTLYYTDSLATGAMPMDGLKVMFDNAFNNVVDQVDARKMYNLDETMSVLRDGTNLSIELMNRPDSTTVIPLNITNYRTQKYTFRMRWTNPYTGINNKVTAFLKDKYTGMQYEVNNILTTDIPYTIDAAIPASYAANRFDIVFMPTAMVALPIAEIALTAAVQQNGIKLQWTNPYDKDLSKYEVERSADGRVFTKLNTQAAGNGIQKNIIYNWFDATPIEGYNYYRIKGLALNNGKTQWSNNLKIRSWTLNIGTTIVPNPAERIGLNVKTDLPKGYYDMKLIDSRGRVVYTKGMEYNGLGGAIELRYGVQLAAGTYYLHIEGMGERVVRTAVVQ